MIDLDFAMLDASDWREPVEEARPVAPWVDLEAPSESEHYTDTGARASDRDQWLRARLTGIGASEAALILGESDWGDMGTVVADRIGQPRDRESREWLEWGHRMEPVILAAVCEPRYAGSAWPDISGHLDGRLLRSRVYPWALCTLDAWICIEGRRVPLEIKTARDADGWEAADSIDGVRREYAIQAHWQMLVTGKQRVLVACLIGGSRLIWGMVERDETIVRRLVRAGWEAWDHVTARTMPETMDGDALARVYPLHDGRRIELEGREWVITETRRQEALATARAARKEAGALSARIKRAMGSAEVAVLDDGTEITWRTQRDGRRVLRSKSDE